MVFAQTNSSCLLLSPHVTDVSSVCRRQALKKTQNFHLGDSAPTDQRQKWKTFFARLDDFAALREPWTLILEDPLANSFISAVSADADPLEDPRLVLEVRHKRQEGEGEREGGQTWEGARGDLHMFNVK
jgi:C4-type Zn-finger protein